VIDFYRFGFLKVGFFATTLSHPLCATDLPNM
jgi:hypothetical protein